MRLALVSAFILVIWIPPTASMGQTPSSNPFDPEWSLVANSNWILRGRLGVPKKELEEAIRTGKGEHIPLEMDVIDVIKGPADLPIERLKAINYWSGKDDYTTSPKDVQSLDGRDILIFLHVYEAPERFAIFVYQDKQALRPYDAKKVERLKQEIRNQRLIAENFAKLPAAKPDEFEKSVKELISNLLVKETQQETIYALQKLDSRAAPSVIRLMDDRRPLPDSHTQFLNTSGKGFEGILHYGPKIVLEALATVLGSLTDHSFGRIFNGGTDEERKQTVDAWRVYLHYRISEEAKPNTKAPAPAK